MPRGRRPGRRVEAVGEFGDPFVGVTPPADGMRVIDRHIVAAANRGSSSSKWKPSRPSSTVKIFVPMRSSGWARREIGDQSPLPFMYWGSMVMCICCVQKVPSRHAYARLT
jgi:hypothetical protein